MKTIVKDQEQACDPAQEPVVQPIIDSGDLADPRAALAGLARHAKRPEAPNHEVGIGTNGIWFKDKAPSPASLNAPLGAIVVTETAGIFEETWIIVDKAAVLDLGAPIDIWAIDKSMQTTAPYISVLPLSLTTYYKATMAVEYKAFPSASVIAGLSDTLKGTVYSVENTDQSGTSTLGQQGQLLRESLGGDTYVDHWIFWKDYEFPTESVGNLTRVHSAASTTQIKLKDYLADALSADPVEWYVMAKFTVSQETI